LVFGREFASQKFLSGLLRGAFLFRRGGFIAEMALGPFPKPDNFPAKS
jgi:hypothetical protein